MGGVGSPCKWPHHREALGSSIVQAKLNVNYVYCLYLCIYIYKYVLDFFCPHIYVYETYDQVLTHAGLASAASLLSSAAVSVQQRKESSKSRQRASDARLAAKCLFMLTLTYMYIAHTPPPP